MDHNQPQQSQYKPQNDRDRFPNPRDTTVNEEPRTVIAPDNTAPVPTPTPVSFAPAVPQPVAPSKPEFAPTASQTSSRPKFGFMSGKNLKSNAYLPEYLLMLISLGSILASINTLVSYGIDALGETGSSSAAYDPFGAVSSFSMVISLASLAVFVPFFVALYKRTRNSESETPLIRAHRWRKGFLGAFIVLQVLAIIGSLIAMFYDIFSKFIPQANLYSAYASTDSSADAPLWKPIVSTLIHVILTSLVVWIVTRDYRQSREGQ